MLRTTIIFVCLLLSAFLGTTHAQDGSFSGATMSHSMIPLPPGQAEAARYADSMANAISDVVIVAVGNNSPCNDCPRRGECNRKSGKMNKGLTYRYFAPRYAKTRRRFCR